MNNATGYRETPVLTPERIDTFIAGCKFPKFAAYVVGQLQKCFQISREDAVKLWEEHKDRINAVSV